MVTIINKQEQQQEEGQKQAIKIADIKIGSRLRKKLTNIDSLAASIAKVGLLHPPVIDENNNKLIAGFRRIKACEKLGWTEIPVRRINIKNAIQGEYDENVERAGFALEDVAAIHEEVQKTRIGHRPAARKGGGEEEKVSNLDSLTSSSSSSSSFPTGSSLEVTGKIAGKPHGTVAMMVAVAKAVKANPDRRPELIYDTRSYAELARDVDSGKTRLSKAYSIIKNNEEMIRKRAETEAFARELKLPKTSLLNADSTTKDIPQLKNSSVDLILTDPPYARESLALYDSLAKLACAKLKEGGSLVFYYPDDYEPEIHAIFSKYKEQLTWWRPLYVKHEGNGTRIHTKGVWGKMKRMMWFVKGKDKLFDNDIHNFIESSKPDKTTHPWAQSSVEAEYIVKNMTVSEDSLVVDPFLGSGAFGIAAIKLGRYFIGVEKDREVYERARDYIAQETAGLLEQQ